MQQIIIDFGRLEFLGLDISLRIFGYGLMLVFGFLSAIYLAQRAARRAGESPHNVAHCGLIALVFGVLGARIAYIIENWSEFTGPGAGPGKMLNITSGGLIYYGGVVLAMAAVLAFLRARRLPIRRYLDIVAPALMLGLAFGRAGCTLNGCCYGQQCSEDWPLAMRFPLYSQPMIKLDGRDSPFSAGTEAPSPVYGHQLYTRPSERLVNPFHREKAAPGSPVLLIPVWDRHGPLPAGQLDTMLAAEEERARRFAATAGSDERIARHEWLEARKSGEGFLRGSEHWSVAVEFDADADLALNLDEAEAYLLWRRNQLEKRFGDLSDAANASAADEALRADELTPQHVPLDARMVNWALKEKDERLSASAARHAAETAEGGDARIVQMEYFPLLPTDELHGPLSGDQLATMRANEPAVREMFDRLAGPGGTLEHAEWDRGLADGDGLLRGSEHWSEAVAVAGGRTGMLTFEHAWRYLQWRRNWLERKFGPLEAPEAAEQANRYLQASEVALAGAQRSLPVKPAQPLGIVNALLLAGLLMAFSRLRTREGQVFALLLILYPITRFLLEMVRANAHDLSHGVLTHNQYTSMILVTAGLGLMVLLHKLPASAGPAAFERAGRTAPNGRGAADSSSQGKTRVKRKVRR